MSYEEEVNNFLGKDMADTFFENWGCNELNDPESLSEEELSVGANYDGHDFTRDKDPANRGMKYGVSLF